MEGKFEGKWKQRPIRMPDELWYSLVKKAAELGIPTAEYIRNILEKI